MFYFLTAKQLMMQKDLFETLSNSIGVSKYKVRKLFLEFNKIARKEFKEYGKVPLLGLGYLSYKVMEEKVGFNPRAKEKINIPKHGKVFFKQSSQMKTFGKDNI